MAVPAIEAEALLENLRALSREQQELQRRVKERQSVLDGVTQILASKTSGAAHEILCRTLGQAVPLDAALIFSASSAGLVQCQWSSMTTPMAPILATPTFLRVMEGAAIALPNQHRAPDLAAVSALQEFADLRSALLFPFRGPNGAGFVMILKREAGHYQSRDAERMRKYAVLAAQGMAAVERASIVEQLGEKTERADAANVAKSQFLANISHELRTPLNAIIGYSELMIEEAEADSDVASDAGRIANAGRHLLRLIDEILDFSKIEAGKTDLCVARFDVEALVREILETMRPAAAKNSNALRLEIYVVAGDACNDSFRLRQCLLNLLSNACKFTEAGTVTLKVSRDGGLLCFAVSDTGIGLSNEQIARLFEPFTQAHGSISRGYGGTGLGLTITRRLAVMMGGDLDVASAEGEGTTFRLRVASNLPETAMGQAA